LLEEFFVVSIFLLYILFGLGGDERGTLRKAEGAEGLLVVGGGGGDGGDHEGSAVTPEGFGEDMCEQ
jgi:hypothetical protein